jgi:hypothetical protein
VLALLALFLFPHSADAAISQNLPDNYECAKIGGQVVCAPPEKLYPLLGKPVPKAKPPGTSGPNLAQTQHSCHQGQ